MLPTEGFCDLDVGPRLAVFALVHLQQNPGTRNCKRRCLSLTHQGFEFRPLRLCQTNNEYLFHGYILVLPAGKTIHPSA